VDVFRQFDTDNSGFLEHDEFMEAVRMLDSGGSGSCSVSNSQLRELARIVDSGGTGRVNIRKCWLPLRCLTFIA
jgi:Ca2+-binding EF-hand superfamily protein